MFKEGSMTRLTVLYNLPEGTNEEDYLGWRLGEHQESNSAMEGVTYTDFSMIDASWPPESDSPYRFMTIAEFESREIFEKSFYAEEVQNKLKGDIKRIKDPVFLISDILVKTDKRGE